MTADGAGARGRRRAPRIALALGTAFGVAYLARTLAVSPGAVATDFEIFRAAAANLWGGGPVYGESPVGVPVLTYRYPPIVLLWFSPFLLLPPGAGYLLHAAGTVAAGVALGLVAARATESHGIELARLDRALIVGFVTVGSWAAPSLLYGNVNHHVALATGLGLVWLREDRQVRAGASLALAAVVKVFPAGVGVWLLWRRSRRAIGAALATGIGALAAGAALLGLPLTRAYVTEELLPRSAPEAFAGGLAPSSQYVTLRRPLSVAFPEAGAAALALGALALIAPVVWFCYVRCRGPTDRLVAVFATLSAVLLVLPSYSLYWLVLAYPLVPLLYVLDGRTGTAFAAGAALATLGLELPDVRTVLAPLPLGPGAEAGAMAAARAVYTVGTPVLWGTLVMLAACLWRVGTDGDGDVGAAADDGDAGSAPSR